MKKVLIISRCNDCCHFDDHYYSYNERCTQLDRVIKRDSCMSMDTEIPMDCPLKDATDE